MPVLNEVEHIENMVSSIVAQQCEDFDIELLLVDGGSTDGTIEKIALLQKQCKFTRIIHNEKRITPAAFNKGIQAAKGEYIAILGAHSKYDTNYLSVCLQELHKHKVAGCSGKVSITKNEADANSILIYYLLTSKFGVSSKSFRTAREGIGEQCPYPLFKKTVFDMVGLYNEHLPRNQDNDMNFRIRKCGYLLYYTHKVSAYYYPKQTIAGQLKYAFNNGKGNAVSLFVNPASMSARHIIPFFFTGSIFIFSFLILVSLFFSLLYTKILAIALLTLIIVHFTFGCIEAIKSINNSKKIIVLVLPFLFFSFHFLYGWGIIKGLFSRR